MILPAKKIDEKGRCCGKKPLEYTGKRYSQEQKFCSRCCRSFDRQSGEQIENWSYLKVDGGFIPNPEIYNEKNPWEEYDRNATPRWKR